MRIPEFADRLGSAMHDETGTMIDPGAAERALVMVKDKKTGVMYGVSEIILEVSEEGDAHTLWIEIDEY